MGLLVCPLKLTYDKLATSAAAGTGKTMLVKAVAHHTTASVGSEFVQKYFGEGPRMVRDLFRLPRENSPAIISSTKSTPSRQNELTHRPAPTVKSSGFCPSC